MREWSWLRIFRVQPHGDIFFIYTAIDFDCACSGSRAFWIMTKQNSEYAEQRVLQVDRLGRLLLQMFGATCRFHIVSLNYDMETRAACLGLWTVSVADHRATSCLVAHSDFPTSIFV